MNIAEKEAALVRLGQYLAGNSPELEAVKERAYIANGWFTPDFINQALDNISRYFLAPAALQQWLAQYPAAARETAPKTVGIVAAGNIPLVVFHDWLCGFISGHHIKLKLSGKDEVLMKHILAKMEEWYPEVAQQTVVQDMLKDCDAYIATGSNNSSRYFHYYFAKYPHIIRHNRTSAALLTGTETPAQLEALADDIMQYFGLGCRNVTRIGVPEGYDFTALLTALDKYKHLADHHKYKNNYDYNLALLLLNSSPYLTNGTLLLRESAELFSPLSVLYYSYYQDMAKAQQELQQNEVLQCLVGSAFTPFGQAQQPSLSDYADGVDTLAFLLSL
ncbi:acyl-CoA reductase [Chitinophaga nivalis]|uniref:Acyl-CoA reductase n=1 Tax=Chitinophaga nivalis TaxID=2991709 RepID=A0ABT3IQL3_9BACT|nr:acyl-CoA reductase [Chitinophaga nivalis]MCW3464033.1 acyl-CoA reductase [Chitinophaga nivalis]MCW3486277.1 acyl-CoA reductase [Chitinophaga nivalis]